MRGTMVIASRELAEKRFIFAAAFAFAILALLMPFVPGVHAPASEVIVVASVIMANFTLGLAVMLGASMVGRDLSEGRLSFYFARPVSASAIWFGKLIAAAVLIAVSFAIIITPAMAFGAVRFRQTWSANAAAVAGLSLLLSLILFFGAHIIGTMVRSRSVWIVADFVCAILAALAGWTIVRPLLFGMAPETIEIMAIAAGAGVLLCAIGAGAWQLAQGRTDRVRSHKEMSRFLWSGVAAILVLAAGFTLWAVSAKPRDLTGEVDGRLAGSWAMVAGEVRHRGDFHTAFLLNVNDGRYVRLAAPTWWGADTSRDGSTAAWMQPVGLAGRGGFELMVARMNVANPQVRNTGISASGWDVSLSPDGSRVALRVGDGTTLYDLASGRSLGSFAVPGHLRGYTEVEFLDRDHVRAFFMRPRRVGERPPVEVFDYDVAARSLRHAGQIENRVADTNADRTRLIAGHTVYDAATLAPLFTLDRSAPSRFLEDGSIAQTQTRDGHAFVQHISAAGERLAEIALPYASAWITTTRGSRAFLQVRSDGSATVVSVDVARGVVERVDPELRRVLRGERHGSSAEILCTTRHGLVAWNPATGAKRTVAGS